MFSYYIREWRINIAYLKSLGLQKNVFILPMAFFLVPGTLSLYWLREIQTEISFHLYYLYDSLYPPSQYRYVPETNAPQGILQTTLHYLKEFLKLIASMAAYLAFAVCNGPSLFWQHKDSYVVLSLLCCLVLFPLWLPTVHFLILLEPLESFLFATLGEILGAVFLDLAITTALFIPFLPVLSTYLKVYTKKPWAIAFANILHIAAGAIAIYYAASISLIWATLASWYIFEPLFLTTRPFNPEPFTFTDDAAFNDRALVNLLFHKKFLQLENYLKFGRSAHDKEQIVTIIDKLFSRFFNNELDPGIRIRFVHHFFTFLAKNQRKLTQKEYHCILNHLQKDKALFKETTIYAQNLSRISCSISHTERRGNREYTITWSQSASHKNPYLTLLDESLVLFHCLNPQPTQQQQPSLKTQGPAVLQSLKARLDTVTAMTDGTREQIMGHLQQARARDRERGFGY